MQEHFNFLQEIRLNEWSLSWEDFKSKQYDDENMSKHLEK